MARTVWYPGHMAKGKRQLEALASAIDVIIEVRDARAPVLTSSPMFGVFRDKMDVRVVLSKADLAEESVTALWVGALKKNSLNAYPLDLRKGGTARFKKALLAKRPSFRDLRIAVVGTPNVGKSMLINQLVGRRAARVGGIPGITRGVSWFKGEGFLMVDSPGILDLHADPRAHKIMSWIGSSRGQIIGNWEEHAKDCMAFLIERDLWGGVVSAWGIEPGSDTAEILSAVGKRLGKLLPGGAIDLESAGRAFIEAFSTGKFGRMSFERPGEPPIWEALTR